MTETWRFQKRTRKHSEKNFYVPYVVKNFFDSVLSGLILVIIIYFVPTNVTQRSFANWKIIKKWS